MPFQNIKIVDPYVDNGMSPEIRLTLAKPEDVEDLERELGTALPVGYQEYVTTLGLGEYCNYIRVDMPASILSGYNDYQKFLGEYYFWELGEETLSKERALESISIASTVDGDVIIFHPANSAEIFVLPRNDDMLYRIGSNLYEAIDWLCIGRNSNTGVVGEKHELRYFVPYNPLQYDHGILFPDDI